MKFNKEITNILDYVSEQNPEEFSQIENFLRELPDFSLYMQHYNSTSGLSIKADGTCFGETGVWRTSLKVDNNGEVSSLRLVFEGEHNSRKPKSNQLRLCLSSISENAPLYGLKRQTLVDYSHVVTPNYRVVAQSKNMTSLSSSDVLNLSKSVVLTHFIVESDHENISTQISSSVNAEVVEA